MQNKYLKVISSIISGIIIFCVTNLSVPSNNISIKKNSIYKYIYHEEGTVCPLGIFLGKVIIPLILLQIYFILSSNYSNNVRKINIFLLILGILLSLLNYRVLIQIIPAFLLQLFVLW